MKKIELIELVRLLEQRAYPFTHDPATATNQVKHLPDDVVDKLHRRAQIIDSQKTFTDRLNHYHRLGRQLVSVACVLSLVLGFCATYGLMQQSALNFFVVLFGILGLNSIMLLIWLMKIVFFSSQSQQYHHQGWYLGILGKSDGLQAACLQLYANSSLNKLFLWRRYGILHQIALCGLVGMGLAVGLLLLVKQYYFVWESTLLNHQDFIKIINLISWLPEHLGFDVPHMTEILASRNRAHSASAAAWGELLLGSILCYGWLPRGLAYGFSLWQSRNAQQNLDLNLPYYQNIIQKWQRKIVDSDSDYAPDPIRPTPKNPKKNTEKSIYLAISVDTQPENPQWYAPVLGQDWLDGGVVASREDWANLTEKSNGKPLQLLVAIRATQTPERGTIRRLSGIHADLVLYFWGDDGRSETAERLAQWQKICEEYSWTYLTEHAVQAA